MARGSGAGATTQVRARCHRSTHPRVGDQEAPRFGHPIEQELAALFDAYGIAWEYEPRTFPLRALDPDGEEVDCESSLLLADGRLPDGYRLVEAFSPDFYLPGLDRYVETTVMLPRNATRKNRKIRRLRVLYPELKISLFDRRDFERLAASHPGGFSHVPAHGVADTSG